jgi:iron complex outermembrane receptor protein
LFLAIAQSGFSRVIGNQFLKPERAWQIDAGLRADSGDFRGAVRGYFAWIIDYITYSAFPIAPGVSDPTGARFLAPTINISEATLAGFEMDGAYDVADWLTIFGSLGYTEGHDLELSVPLYGVAPLEGRVGLRVHDPAADDEPERWGVEFFGRIVDNQHRLGALRNFLQPDTAFLVEEPTPGFNVWHLRAYAMATRNLRLTAGVENLFDLNYLEHLDLRLPAQPADGIPELRLLAPGITPYFGAEWTY